MFVGIISEDHLPGTSMGPLGTAILRAQFLRLRDGDRFFYTGDAFFEDPFVESLVDLNSHTLSQVIQLNTGMSMQDNVFFAVPEASGWILLLVGGLAIRTNYTVKMKAST